MTPASIGIDARVEFADSHVHLAHEQFAADVDEVIARARASGARAMVCIGESPAAAESAAAISARYPGLIWFSSGLHPHEASRWSDQNEQVIRRDVDRGAVAIGECGLDYHYDFSPRPQQQMVFARQLELARELDRPVIVHTRDAEDDTRAMVTEAAQAGVRGVLHCFTGSRALAECALDAGWYLSLTGVITFKRYTDDEILRLIPPDRYLVESDAPYLAPVPHRGHRNESSWVSLTIQRIAAARGVPVAQAAAESLRNTQQFFNLTPAS